MFIFELVVCILSVSGYGYLFFNSLNLKRPKQFWDGPGAFPAVLSVLCFLLCLIWLVDVIKNRSKGKKNSEGEVTVEKKGLINTIVGLWANSGVRNITIIIALTVLYILVLMPTIGFAFATFVFLFVTIFLFYEKKWLTALIVSVITSGGVYVLFKFVLHLPLPR